MTNYKGTGIKTLRNMFEKQGKDVENKFLAALSTDEREVYEAVMATSWVPVMMAGRIFSKAAETLFPGDPEGLVKLGREQAINNLTGIYKIILRITTVEFALNQTAVLWKTYFDKGEAQSTANTGEKTGLLYVTGAPDLPRASRQVVAGYVLGVMELLKIREIKIQHVDTNPQKWEWKASWQ